MVADLLLDLYVVCLHAVERARERWYRERWMLREGRGDGDVIVILSPNGSRAGTTNPNSVRRILSRHQTIYLLTSLHQNLNIS